MKNLIIFGNEFGDPKINKQSIYNTTFWFDLLETKYKVTNCCETDSGLKYSFKALNNYNSDIQKFDKIIFLVSDPRRLYLDANYHKIVNNPHFNLDNLKLIKHKHIKFTIDNYPKHFIHDEIETCHYHLIVKNLKKRFGKKILLLKCFDILDTAEIDNLFDNEMCLNDISEYEEKVLNIERENCNNFLTLSHHKMLYNKISTWIDTGEFSLSKEDLIKSLKDLKHNKKV